MANVTSNVNTALGLLNDLDFEECAFCGRAASGALAVSITVGMDYTFCCREHGLLWADRVRRLLIVG